MPFQYLMSRTVVCSVCPMTVYCLQLVETDDILWHYQPLLEVTRRKCRDFLSRLQRMLLMFCILVTNLSLELFAGGCFRRTTENMPAHISNPEQKCPRAQHDGTYYGTFKHFIEATAKQANSLNWGY